MVFHASLLAVIIGCLLCFAYAAGAAISFIETDLDDLKPLVALVITPYIAAFITWLVVGISAFDSGLEYRCVGVKSFIFWDTVIKFEENKWGGVPRFRIWYRANGVIRSLDLLYLNDINRVKIRRLSEQMNPRANQGTANTGVPKE